MSVLVEFQLFLFAIIICCLVAGVCLAAIAVGTMIYDKFKKSE